MEGPSLFYSFFSIIILWEIGLIFVSFWSIWLPRIFISCRLLIKPLRVSSQRLPVMMIRSRWNRPSLANSRSGSFSWVQSPVVT